MMDAVFCCSDFYQLPIAQYFLGDSFHPGGLTLTRQLAEQLLINRESRVLDVASGLGATSLFLAEHYGCNLIALDLAEGNLQLTRQSAKSRQLSSLIKTIQSSATELPFADNSFDAIICECALSTFPKPDIVIAEMYRILKPGARLGISDVYIKKPLTADLKKFSNIFCINNNFSIDHYQSLIEAAHFNRIQFKQVDWAIDEMLIQIENKVSLLDSMTAEITVELPSWIKTEMPTLLELKRLVKNGAIGYLLVNAIKV